MRDVKVFGVFQENNGNIFRKSAYIQWGVKKESIGSFLLLNPGKAKPSDQQVLREGTIKRYRVDMDPTMRQMVKLIEKIYGTKELNGRIHIYNLFALRNPKDDDAISCFEQLAEDNVINPLEVLPPVEELQKHPWICCGWGINSENRYKHLQQIKSSWNIRLRESGIPTFGKRHKNGIDYYHLRPRLVEDQDKLINELSDMFRDEIGKNSKESYWVSVVYFDYEYIIIIDDKPFKEVEPIVTIDCEGPAEVRTAIKVLKVVYGNEGNVHTESLLPNYDIDKETCND